MGRMQSDARQGGAVKLHHGMLMPSFTRARRIAKPDTAEAPRTSPTQRGGDRPLAEGA